MKRKKRKPSELGVIVSPINNISRQEYFKEFISGKVDPMNILKALCRQKSPDIIRDIRDRESKLEEAADSLDWFIAPDEENIVEKLVMPLNSAKQAYCLADYLSCIALCGMVCEMAMVFIFEMIPKWLDIDALSEEHRRVFEKRKFEKLGQKKRIQVLLELGVILESMPTNAETVRKIWKSYLHFLSKSHSKIAEDALTAYVSTSAILKPLLHIGLDSDGLHVPKHLADYFVDKGISIKL